MKIKGPIAVYEEGINTDDITEAALLKYSAKDPEGLRQLGLACLQRKPTVEGLPLIEEGESQSKYKIIIAGKNFGCGSSREQSPYALAAAGIELVVAPSFAPIFWNNVFSSGIPLKVRTLSQDLTTIPPGFIQTGKIWTYHSGANKLFYSGEGKGKMEFTLNPLSERDAKLEEAGGLENYALQNFRY